jgi:hypothetical protein
MKYKKTLIYAFTESSILINQAEPKLNLLDNFLHSLQHNISFEFIKQFQRRNM